MLYNVAPRLHLGQGAISCSSPLLFCFPSTATLHRSASPVVGHRHAPAPSPHASQQRLPQTSSRSTRPRHDAGTVRSRATAAVAAVTLCVPVRPDDVLNRNPPSVVGSYDVEDVHGPRTGSGCLMRQNQRTSCSCCMPVLSVSPPRRAPPAAPVPSPRRDLPLRSATAQTAGSFRQSQTPG